jgi:general stress protein YciG
MSINENSGTRQETAETAEHLTPDGPPHAVEAARGGETKTPRPRGFAAMDRRLVTEIARKGGKAAHTAGTAHEFTTDEAREAGRKGGRATHAKRRKAAEDQAEPATTEEKQQ